MDVNCSGAIAILSGRLTEPTRKEGTTDDRPHLEGSRAHRGRGRVRLLHRGDRLHRLRGDGGPTAAPGPAPPREDGRTEFLTFSLWESVDAIRAFAGDDIETAVYYPDDDRYLIERDETVRHYEVVDGAGTD